MTTVINELKPARKDLVIDLVRAAGIDVADWANVTGGAARASVNPKYCYEWAFASPGRVVVLNLWHTSLRDEDGSVYAALDYARTERDLVSTNSPTTQIGRARRAGAAVREAFVHQLPVRVIINDGERRPDRSRGTSRVKARQLDPVAWHVDSYDLVTGGAVLVRGPRSDRYLDQYSAPQSGSSAPARRTVSRLITDRSRSIRNAALARARGCCEWCKEPGFSTPRGLYLETHHIIPLAEDGPDEAWNVIALCPHHHRRAHHGLGREVLRAGFQRIVRASSGGPGA